MNALQENMQICLSKFVTKQAGKFVGNYKMK